MFTDDPVGTRVLQVNAYDVDRGSSLRYSIVPGSYSARDPFNRDVLSAVEFDFTVSQVQLVSSIQVSPLDEEQFALLGSLPHPIITIAIFHRCFQKNSSLNECVWEFQNYALWDTP